MTVVVMAARACQERGWLARRRVATLFHICALTPVRVFVSADRVNYHYRFTVRVGTR